MPPRPGTAYPASTVRTCTPAAEEGVPVPGGMEQGVLNVQPAQVGAAPDEVPLCPEAGKPVPQGVAGIPPDRRVAVQSERLTEDLDGQRLNNAGVGPRLRRRVSPSICRTTSSITQYSQTRRRSRSMLPKALKPWQKSLIFRSRAEGS